MQTFSKVPFSQFIASLAELTKFRLVLLVLWTTAVGYLLAARGPIAWARLFHLLFATGLVAAGSLALNQWLERDFDVLMQRTAGRPIPSGRMHPSLALKTGAALSFCGMIYLFFASNRIAALIAGVTWCTYLFCYTPLKRKTTFNTIAGALPGALPPLIGWAGVRGTLSYESWILFSILFLWQLPHFLALAWLFREDYKRAGFVMLSLGDQDGKRVGLQAVIASAALIPVSLLPSLFGITGKAYFMTALLLGAGLLGVSLAGLRDITRRARSLFAASIIYLSLLFLVMVIDKT